MSLINCPECGLTVSSRAASCPHCGYPIQENLPTAVPTNHNNALYQNELSRQSGGTRTIKLHGNSKITIKPKDSIHCLYCGKNIEGQTKNFCRTLYRAAGPKNDYSGEQKMLECQVITSVCKGCAKSLSKTWLLLLFVGLIILSGIITYLVKGGWFLTGLSIGLIPSFIICIIIFLITNDDTKYKNAEEIENRYEPFIILSKYDFRTHSEIEESTKKHVYSLREMRKIEKEWEEILPNFEKELERLANQGYAIEIK